MSGEQSVLIVDDDPGMRRLLRLMLGSVSLNILEAADARTALRLASYAMPDLIVMDLILPDSAGFNLAHEIRALPRGGKVVLVAISGMQSRLEDAWSLRGGFDAYLFKPFDADQLVATVEAHLPHVGPLRGPFGAGRRVLVVDDSPVQRKLLEHSLRDWGFEVTATDGVAHALEEAHREAPVAIVSDVLMPEASGFDLCLAVRRDAALARIPVVLVSAATPEEADLELARQVAANAVLMGSPGFWGLEETLVRSLAGDASEPIAPIDELVVRDELARRGERPPLPPWPLPEVGWRGPPASVALAALARLAQWLDGVPAAGLDLDEAVAIAVVGLAGRAGVLFGCGVDGRLELRGKSGPAGELVEQLAPLFADDGVRAAVLALDRSRTVSASEGASTDPLVQQLATRVGAAFVRAASVTPLRHGPTPLGVLVIDVGEVPVRGMTEVECAAFLTAVAGFLALALALERASG